MDVLARSHLDPQIGEPQPDEFAEHLADFGRGDEIAVRTQGIAAGIIARVGLAHILRETDRTGFADQAAQGISQCFGPGARFGGRAIFRFGFGAGLFVRLFLCVCLGLRFGLGFPLGVPPCLGLGVGLCLLLSLLLRFGCSVSASLGLGFPSRFRFRFRFGLGLRAIPLLGQRRRVGDDVGQGAVRVDQPQAALPRIVAGRMA